MGKIRYSWEKKHIVTIDNTAFLRDCTHCDQIGTLISYFDTKLLQVSGFTISAGINYSGAVAYMAFAFCGYT